MLWAMHGTSVQQRQYVIARRIQPDSKYMVLFDSMYEYVRVWTSTYAYVRVCSSMYQYNQGLQIFMICAFYFSPPAPKNNVLCLGDVSVHL
jgi:hypothetical protein